MDRRRALALLTFAAYGLFLAFVLLSPTGDVPSTGLSWASDVFATLGTPEWLLEPTRFEFLSNVLIFTPLAVLGTWAWPRHSVWLWVLAGVVGSAAVETLQGTVLPDRTPSVLDVVANSLGAVLGGLAVAGWRVSRRRTAGGTPPTNPDRPGPRRDPRR